MIFCHSCGKSIPDESKFCQYCGSAIISSDSNRENQQQEYIGKMYKCPNCGQALKSSDTVCSSCGTELRGIKAVDSINDLAKKLEKIEASREHHNYKNQSKKYDEDEISETDNQKINLIRNFPIPNTIEDISEFLVLAIANINMRAYGRFSDDLSNGERSISDAWKSKAEQAYQKARILFGNQKEFKVIEEIYNQKEHEIQQKIEEEKKENRQSNFRIDIVTIIIIGLFLIFALIVNKLNK